MSKSESLHQAALVLKTLPKGEAAQIMAKLDARDLREVIQQTESLGETDPDEVLAALNLLSIEAESLKTDRDEERKLLNRRLTVGNADEEDQQAGPFRFLVHLAPQLRLELLENEHPENIALVLMHLPTDIASDVLKELDSPSQVSIVRRLCAFEDVSCDQVSDLAFQLKMRLQKHLQRGDSASGVRLAAQLLSCSDKDTQNQVLEYINQLDPSLVNELEESMFRFDDMSRLDNLDVQIILKNVDTSFWAPALKVASLRVREKILGNMASRVAQILSQEIAELRHVDDQIASHAQTQIINVCIRLNELGKIQWVDSTTEPPSGTFKSEH